MLSLRCRVTLSRFFLSRSSSNAATEHPVVPDESPADNTPPAVRNEPADPKLIHRPPHYRKVHRHHMPKHMLQDEFPNAGDVSGSGARLFDYYKMADLVNSMPTIQEKIDIVNPYERPWTRAEKTWRRDWHPSLMATRKAWALPLVPSYFDCLNYYKYITKSRLVEGPLDDLYETLNPATELFEKTFAEALLHNLKSPRFDSTGEKVDAILAAAADCATMSLAHNVKRLADYRTAYNCQSEAFWIRAGFMFLYDFKELGTETTTRKLHNAAKYIGDDRRKLGELAFTSRDRLSVQVRSRTQPKDLFGLDSAEVETPVFDESVDVNEDVLFSPKVFNLWPDENPLWQCPGYFPESEETHPYGRLAFKSLSGLKERFEYWKIAQTEFPETLSECIKAQTVSSLFTTLCAQAHAQGFTQYTDVTRPFTSQLVLSDGQYFAFAVGQLNTLAINIDCDGFVNNRTNVVRFEGPFRLYDEIVDGEFVHSAKNEKGEMVRQKGLNEQVLSRILQMVLRG